MKAAYERVIAGLKDKVAAAATPRAHDRSGEGGFTVRAGPGLTADLLPCQIRVSMAYDLEDGDPLRSWSPYDFNLGDRDGDIEIEQDGASIVELRGNQMLIEARDPGFRVRVLGFDSNRDLEVRVDRRRESAS